MFKACLTPRAVFTTLALAGLVLMIGCGALDQGPLAPRTATPKASPRLGLTSPTNLTDIHTESDAELVSPTAEGLSLYSSDNALETHFPEYGDADYVRVESTYFTIQKGSVDREALITMTAFSGSKVKDARVKFSPDGLVFKHPATLTILLHGPVNSERLKAYHTSSDGTVTVIPHTLSDLGDSRWQVVLSVPGFSEYSLGDDGQPPPQGGGP